MSIEKLVYGHEEYAVPVNIVDEIPERRIAVGLDGSRCLVYFVTGYQIVTNENSERVKDYRWQPVHQFDSTHGMKPEVYMDLEKASKAFDKIYLLHSWNDFKDIPNIEYYS